MMVEYEVGQSGVGQGVKNGWDIKSGGQERRGVMGYHEGERAGNCCEDKCYRTGYSVEEGGGG